MKIAVQNPLFLFSDPSRNFNGYNFAFFKEYVSIIYLTRPWQLLRYRQRLKEVGINPDRYRFIFRLKTLNSQADILMGFDGELYDSRRTPPKGFQGQKIWHVMDYVFKAKETARLLSDNGVGFVMGYARHDRHCAFFQHHFPSFLERVIPVPFGHGDRFKSLVSFQERKAACVAMGAVNPVKDPLCPPGTIDDYISFYSHKTWTHEFRRAIATNISTLTHIDSFLPLFPETKNPHIDPVKELNGYQLYANDEGILNFPPARTYEGIAAGCVMVASRNPIYEELGFVDGVNYIAFAKNDLQDFQQKIREHIQQPKRLLSLHSESLRLAAKFTHHTIAADLYRQVLQTLK